MIKPFCSPSEQENPTCFSVTTAKPQQEKPVETQKFKATQHALSELLLKEGPSHVVVVCPNRRTIDSCIRSISLAGITCDKLTSLNEKEKTKELLSSLDKGTCEVLVTHKKLKDLLSLKDIRYIVEVPSIPYWNSLKKPKLLGAYL